MLFILTNFGISYLQANPGNPPVKLLAKLGTSGAYTPSPSATDVAGTVVYSGNTSDYVQTSANVLKYTFLVDNTAGPFTFGECGLYLTGSLFAIGVSSTPIIKAPAAAANTNSLVLDCYVSTSGTNQAIYAELGNSDNSLVVGSQASVDSLPQAVTAVPNIFIVFSPDASGSLLAFSNQSLWSVTGYEEVILSSSVASATGSSVTTASVLTIAAPAYTGEYILQFVSGSKAGLMRQISTLTSDSKGFNFVNPLTSAATVGDTFKVYRKRVLSATAASFLAGLNPAVTSAHVNELLNTDITKAVLNDGSRAMQAPLGMGSYRITSLGNPTAPGDAVNLYSMNQAIAQLGSNVYAFTGATSGFDGLGGAVPKPLAGQQNFVLRGDGTWAQVSLAVFSGATAGAAGLYGAVPAPIAGQQNFVLRGNGGWSRASVIPKYVPAPTITSGTTTLTLTVAHLGYMVPVNSSPISASTLSVVLPDTTLFIGDGSEFICLADPVQSWTAKNLVVTGKVHGDTEGALISGGTTVRFTWVDTTTGWVASSL